MSTTPRVVCLTRAALKPWLDANPVAVARLEAAWSRWKRMKWRVSRWVASPSALRRAGIEHYLTVFVVSADVSTIVSTAQAYLYGDGVAVIGTVWTDPAHRRQGHARTCIAALMRRCARRGTTAFALFVKTNKGGARRLYESLGFQKIGRSVEKYNDAYMLARPSTKANKSHDAVRARVLKLFADDGQF